MTLSQKFDLKEYKSGQNIITQGEKGDGFFVIQEGKAKVTLLQSGTTHEVGTLKSGDYLGERALLNSAPRAATVTAIVPTTCLFWSADNFFKLFTRSHLNIKFAKRVAVSAEQMG